MQNIKIMFRSPRFLLGFCMFMLVIIYAIVWPMINTADPKADREENPFYAEVQALTAAIEAQDDATIWTALLLLRKRSLLFRKSALLWTPAACRVQHRALSS